MLIYSLPEGKAVSNSEAKPSPETTLPTEPNNHILASCRRSTLSLFGSSLNWRKRAGLAQHLSKKLWTSGTRSYETGSQYHKRKSLTQVSETQGTVCNLAGCLFTASLGIHCQGGVLTTFLSRKERHVATERTQPPGEWRQPRTLLLSAVSKCQDGSFLWVPSSYPHTY